MFWSLTALALAQEPLPSEPGPPPEAIANVANSAPDALALELGFPGLLGASYERFVRPKLSVGVRAATILVYSEALVRVRYHPVPVAFVEGSVGYGRFDTLFGDAAAGPLIGARVGLRLRAGHFEAVPSVGLTGYYDQRGRLRSNSPYDTNGFRVPGGAQLGRSPVHLWPAAGLSLGARW